jgi:trimeric autotransporter adhesin
MKLNRILICLVVLSSCFAHSNAQSIAINTDGSTPNNKALLDLKSTTMGLLVPRMTTAQITAFSGALTPVEAGMLVYDTDKSHFFFWDGLAFKIMNGTAILSDTDGDTRIQVEESPDEDIIRFDLAGTEKWVMTGARLEPQNSGGSVFLGENAGASDSLFNSGNVAVGRATLKNNGDQPGLVAIGDSALFNNGVDATEALHAKGNTAVGSKSLFANTTGFWNTATGYQTMFKNTTGIDNTANGYQALHENRTGNYNLANGSYALFSHDVGHANTAVGHTALYKDAMGFVNTAVGFAAMYKNISGKSNTAMGAYALYSNTTGSVNTAVGMRTLFRNTDRSGLVAVGDSALYNNGIGVTQSYHATGNTAIGTKSLFTNTAGYANTATGFNAMYSNSTGSYNTACGGTSLNHNLTGDSNTAIGTDALNLNRTGSDNTANGRWALFSNISGSENTAVGAQALNVNSTGSKNTAIGFKAGVAFDSLTNATAIGADVLVYTSNSLVLGKNADVGIGTNAPREQLEVAGDGRVFIGDGGGDSRTGVLIDGVESGNYARIVPYDYGAGVNMDLYLPSDVGIGTATPSYKLEVNGGAGKPGGGSWSNASDRRLKQKVRDYSAGLADLLRIRPVRYQYNELSGYDTSIEYVGVIAQELQEIAPDMVSTFTKDDREYLAVDNSAMTYMLINAVKELAAQNAAQKETNASLRGEIEALMTALVKIDASLKQ